MNLKNNMEYLDDMEMIEEDIMKSVLKETKEYDYFQYTEKDVKNALSKDIISINEFKALLSPVAEIFLEEIAQKAREFTKKYFGDNIYIFTPLYLSNYCENYCIYCGFNSHNSIKRSRLNLQEIEKEMKAIAKTGLKEILILTGESRKFSDINYIGEACKLATRYFNTVGLEIYPVNSDEYKFLNSCGADYVTVFQETYNIKKYSKLHLEGHKKIFPYRFNSQERAIIGGMRGVGFAALLGLDDFRKDAFATGYHASLVQKKYPHSEISISCPRLRPTINNKKINPQDVSEKRLLQIICAYRLFLPFSTIIVSTRENKKFRDNIIKIAANKVSAGVNTGIGSHSNCNDSKGDEQFEIADSRNVQEVFDAIKFSGLQPVMSDYINLTTISNFGVTND